MFAAASVTEDQKGGEGRNGRSRADYKTVIRWPHEAETCCERETLN
jgi:hypothetical protein